MEKCLVLATSNAGKVREMRGVLEPLQLRLLCLDDFPPMEPVEETGESFEANALLKARAVAAATGLLALADDSGLEVDALHGAPGIFSARYADDWDTRDGEGRDARNCRKLLHVLAGLPEESRSARFVCALAVCSPSPQAAPLIVRAAWEGRILEEARGHGGFGYDPVFYVPALRHTAAELSLEEKNRHSHRALALRELLRRWPAFWQSLGGEKRASS